MPFRTSFIVAILISSSAWALQSVSHSEQDVNGQKPTPIELLERSYSMGVNFAPEERCSHLYVIALAATQFRSTQSDAFIKTWSNELFKKAGELPPSWNRSAFQKSALEILSSVDPEAAFRELSMVEMPPLDDKSKAPEDVRAFAAQTIFSRIFEAKGTSALRNIRAAAIGIGRTGEYPYSAMSQVSKKLLELKDKDSVLTIFREAMDFYHEGAHVRSADKDFLDYTNSMWDILPPALKREALTNIVQHLETDDKADPSRSEIVRVVTDKGTINFSRRKTAILFQVLPKVREVDKQWAVKLEEKYSELRDPAAAGSVQHTSSMTVFSTSGSPGQASAVMGLGLQRGTLSQMRELAKTDPAGAANLLGSVSDPELQARALAILAAAFRQTDPERSAALFSAAQKQTDSLPMGPAKLDALAALGEAAASAHDLPRIETEISTAFDLSDELLREELDTSPGETVYSSSVLDSLSKLARLGGEVSVDSTMAQLQKLRSEALQAYLLAAVAQGLNKNGKS